MQTITNHLNEVSAFCSSAWSNAISIPIEKQIAVLLFVVVLGFIMDRAIKALTKCNFMQFKTN